MAVNFGLANEYNVLVFDNMNLSNTVQKDEWRLVEMQR